MGYKKNLSGFNELDSQRLKSTSLQIGVCSGMLFPIEYMADLMKKIARLSSLYYMQHAIAIGKLETMPIVIMLSISFILGLIGVRLIEKRM